MPKFIPRIKKLVLLLVAVSAVGLVILPQLRADTSTAGGAAGGGASTIYLQEIAANTNNILLAVTTAANPIVVMMLSALLNLDAPDNSTDPASPSPLLQFGFSTLGFTYTKIAPSFVNSVFSSLQTDFFNGVSIPNVNDLAFGTLLGAPPANPDPRGNDAGNIVYNYIKNAAGLTLAAPPPGTDWKGSQYDQTNYKNFYNTLGAVQTFNGYLLAQLYSDNMFGFTTLQNALIAQVTSSQTWFSTVTTETIGAVLRQMLMIESQSYVIQTEVLQTQRLMLAALAMNNTMLMVSDTSNQAQMVMRAVKTMPKM